MANPPACAIAVESARILAEENMEARLFNIESQLKAGLAPARDIPGVTDVRVLGSIGVIELHRSVDVGKFQKECVRKGVWIRPFGRNAYIMPPYIISDEQLQTLCSNLIEIISDEGNY